MLLLHTKAARLHIVDSGVFFSLGAVSRQAWHAGGPTNLLNDHFAWTECPLGKADLEYGNVLLREQFQPHCPAECVSKLESVPLARLETYIANTEELSITFPSSNQKVLMAVSRLLNQKPMSYGGVSIG